MHAPSNTIRTRPPRGTLRRPQATLDPERIAAHLRDAAHYPGGHSPAHFLPETEAEVAAILLDGDPVLCIGAQSSLTGGATPRGERLLSTARFDRIERTAHDRVRVGAGVVLRPLLDELRRTGHAYPPVPTYDGATVGGTAATNAAGAATFKYGSTRDWVESLTVVLACGEVLDLRRGEVRADPDGRFAIVHRDGRRTNFRRPDIRMPDVPKISCGYFSRPEMDLIDLFLGAEGTLGVITELELRLQHPAPALLLALVPVATESLAVELTAELRSAAVAAWGSRGERGIDVAAIEYLDARSLAILREDRGAERLGLPPLGEAGAALLIQVELPAGTTNAGAMAQIGSVGTDADDGALARLCRWLDAHGALAATEIALPDDTARQQALRALREAVPEGVNRRVRERQREWGDVVSKAAADVIVPFDRFAEALEAYRSLAVEHGLDVIIWGHISDGNVHPNLLPDNAAAAQRTHGALLEIGRAAIARGGAPMSEHGVGRHPVKQRLLREMYGESGVASMRRLRRALDPRGILARGVLWPG